MHRKFLTAVALLLAGCASTATLDSPSTGAADTRAIESIASDTPPLTLDAPTTAPVLAALYTCPMHPSVISNHPGKCPICGMALEPKAGGK